MMHLGPLFVLSLLVLSETAAWGASLDSLVAEAISKSPKMSSKRAQVGAAKAQSEASGYLPDPQLSMNYFPGPVETRNGPQSATFMLRQGLPWPDDLRADNEAAKAQRDRAAASAVVTRLAVELEVRTLVYRLVQVRKTIANLIEMERVLAGFGEMVSRRHGIGSAKSADASRLAIELAKARVDLAQRRAQREALVASLGETVGRTIQLEELPSALEPTDLELSGGTDQAHPELVEAEAAEAVARANITRARQRAWPKTAAIVSYSRIDETDSLMADSPGKDAWAVGLSVSVPIWQGKYDADIRASSQSLQAQAARVHELKLRQQADRKAADAKVTSARMAYDLYSGEILEHARHAEASDRKAYTLGKLPFDRLIDSTLRHLKIRNAAAQAEAQLAIAVARYRERHADSQGDI